MDEKLLAKITNKIDRAGIQLKSLKWRKTTFSAKEFEMT